MFDVHYKPPDSNFPAKVVKKGDREFETVCQVSLDITPPTFWAALKLAFGLLFGKRWLLHSTVTSRFTVTVDGK